MIPSVIASQIQYGIEDYLRTTFPPESSFFKDILENFFKEPKGIFRGPYLSLKLPYRPGNGVTLFPEIPMKYSPYLHQERAFQRLATDTARSTIIATGTGSGKTECFMYPILDHCWRHRNERGIKAVIVYPMNALATDQSKRFAKEIFHNSDLKGNVTVGLFIGGDEGNGGSSCMTEDNVITNKETMRENPPSILLTNYKMLDLLLLRPKDFPLWRFNNPDTLKYIAVDELHTFDGAQGSDLASLLRRLYSRLKADTGKLCAVGTSATLGDDAKSQEKITKFAHDLFGTDFDSGAVITEDILKPHEFLGDSLVQPWSVPAKSDTAKLNPMKYAAEEEYLRAQSRLWFPEEYALPEKPDEEDRVRLGEALCQHPFFQNLIRLVKDKPLDREEMIQVLEQIQHGISNQSKNYQAYLLNSIYSLISYSLRKFTDNDGSEHYTPFLNVRCQLWLRELRRMVATVEKNPRILFYDDIKPDHGIEALPLVHCRACGQVGYLSVQSIMGNRYSSDLREIYSAFFANSPKVHFIFHDDSPEPGEVVPDEEKVQRKFKTYLCGYCLTVNDGENVNECTDCGKSDALIPVRIENPNKKKGNSRVEVSHDCPVCEGADTLTIIGARSASLISVAISQLFATQFNNDQKLLTFSDSVQDAAHRAVFYEARTFRFNLRAAIQQFISNEQNSMTLAELPDRFIGYWLEKLESRENFVAQFIPPDLQNREFDDFTELKKSGHLPTDSSLLDKVCKRIHWEIFSEYGYRARVGRTLEKTGCSIIALKADKREQWTEELFPRLHNEFGTYRNLERNTVTQFLLGMVRLMRVRGGISADYLNQYQQDGNTKSLNIHFPFLPEFSSKRAPIFLREKSAGGRFDAVLSAGINKTVYHKWLIQSFGEGAIAERNQPADIFQMVFEIGKKLDIITEVSSSRGKIWGLNPKVFEIEKDVEQFVCSQTNHQISVPKSESDYWEKMPSQRFDSDTGRYHRKNASEDSDRDNYYKNLYSQGKVHRVIAREHTGLLSREDRENLENEFIDGHNVAATNTLSCTPTLEMGINVGDLSSIFLCSVPPTKSNFLQRIGRAGRRDGNSINLVVANGVPHDLHFFNEPEEMFDSAITPPGIFLNAPAVLQRQLTAYCFDRWIEEIKGLPNAIPMELKATLDCVHAKDKTRFPYTFFQYIDLHRTELFDDFCKIFTDVINQETKDALHNFFYGSGTEGGVDVKILEGLTRILQTREACQKQIKNLGARLRDLRDRPKDDERSKEEKDLLVEKKAITNRRDGINRKHVFNFFTDEGLLPNYAFPETGVTLRSILYRLNNKPLDQDDKYKTFTGEYERSAQSAISELAPGNDFYVQGRKLTINRIDMTATDKEEWHFCDNCSHIEKTGEGEKHSASCPKCGSAGWADGNLKRTVLKLRQVIANQEESKTHFEDDAEQRQPKFFNNRIMLNFSSRDVLKAYKFNDEKIPFGFEYISRVDFREINFGEDCNQDDNALTIAGEKIGRQGFRVCAECGMVQFDENKLQHHVSCKYYHKNSVKPIIPCVYLYREFTSEAIRILLPVDSMDSGVKIPSLIAAIYMGLKEKYAGNVDHILITKQEGPIEGSSVRKCFLVLYDQVPGGTGYLKELAQSKENIVELLQLAYDKLKNCKCQSDPEKDGCYGCLYAYKTSRDMNRISSKSAKEILGRLVSQSDKFEETDSIENISVNVLFESELEKQFIEGIRKYFSGKPQFSLEIRIYDGRSSYLVKIPTVSGGGSSLYYEIIPQYELGPQQGVTELSRADFLIRALNKPEFKPIAVFTDGYSFHGDINSENYRLPKDLTQRMAIVRSQKYLSWSVSYEDVRYVCDNKKEPHWKPLCSQGELNPAVSLPKEFLDIHTKDSFSMLMCMLENPEMEQWKRLARLMILSISKPIRCIEEDINDLQKVMTQEQDLAKIEEYFRINNESNPFTHCILKRHYHNTPIDSFYSVYTKKENLSKEKVLSIEDKNQNIFTNILFNDILFGEVDEKDFNLEWNSLLQRYNLLQLNAHTTVLTSRMVANNNDIPKEFAEFEDEEWAEIFEYADSSVLNFLDSIQDNKNYLPISGYELADNNGQVIGNAELAWPDEKIAVLLKDDDKEPFVNDHWIAFKTDESNWEEQVKSLLAERIK